MVDAGVEEADDSVGLFGGADVCHPLGGALHHVLELHSAPEAAVEPVWDVRRHQAEHGYAAAGYLKDLVGLEIGLAVGGAHGVGTQNRHLALADVLVVDGVGGFDVVVADADGVVVHVVKYLWRNVFRHGVDKVVVVDRRSALQDVAAVEQHDVFGSVAHGPDVVRDVSHAEVAIFLADKVVGEKRAVNVGCADDVDFLRRRQCADRREQQQTAQFQCFHFLFSVFS